MPLVPGYVPLTETEQFTWAKFLLGFTNGSATIGSQSEITPGVVTVSISAPSGKTGDLWFDTSLGSGYGTLRVFDGSDWKAVAEGFIGQNKSGVTVSAGVFMRLDSSITTALTGARMAVVRTTAATQRPIGVAATTMLNDEVGIVLTKGKVKIAKDAASITAGDAVTASATAGQATTNSVGSWGAPFGSSTCGIWLETSAAAAGTLVTAFLNGNNTSTWTAYKSAPAVVLNAAIPSAFATWQTAVAWSSSPAGTVSHMVQFVIFDTTSSAIGRRSFGLRANGSSLTIDTGAVFLTADCTTVANTQGLRGQLIVPAGSDNTFQWYYDATAGTAANTRVTMHEIGAIVGGQVV